MGMDDRLKKLEDDIVEIKSRIQSIESITNHLYNQMLDISTDLIRMKRVSEINMMSNQEFLDE